VTRAEINFTDLSIAQSLFGPSDQHLRHLETLLNITIHAQNTQLTLHGQPLDLELAQNLLQQLYDLIRRGYPIFIPDIDTAFHLLSRDHKAKLRDVFLDSVFITSTKRVIAPKSFHQKLYIDAIRRHDLVFGVGPAGTGKTYLAMAMALSALTKRQVKRIVLVRPAVEAGEKLGFLPGDMADKVNPYLRPLYDALHDMLDPDRAARLQQEGQIEVAPLAFMRGRTLSQAFIILDEAQNTTREQMKMLLTRLGPDSKAIITGDLSQIDLPHPSRSGLAHALQVLSNTDGISIVRFSDVDVIRHALVQRIIQAYERVSPSPAPISSPAAPSPSPTPPLRRPLDDDPAADAWDADILLPPDLG
jgi:phosphate starvation-inducible protein PhoH and related proteins